MAMVFTAFLSIIGCISIGFAFGWRLTILASTVALPIIMVSKFSLCCTRLQSTQLRGSKPRILNMSIKLGHGCKISNRLPLCGRFEVGLNRGKVSVLFDVESYI